MGKVASGWMKPLKNLTFFCDARDNFPYPNMMSCYNGEMSIPVYLYSSWTVSFDDFQRVRLKMRINH